MERAGRDGKAFGGLLDMDVAVGVVSLLAEREDVDGLRAVIANDSHLLVFIVAPVWFNPLSRLLVEQFFMRVSRGPHTAALADIEQLARDEGASGVLMATMLAADDEALGRLFARRGYRKQSTQHFLELH